MFAYCKECGKKLDEFDVNFIKNLTGSFDEKNSKCASCIVNNGNINKSYYSCEDRIDLLRAIKNSKPNIVKYIFPYIIICAYIFYVVPYMHSVYDFVNTDDLFSQIFFAILPALPFYIGIVSSCVKDFHLRTEEGYEYSYYETKYNDSTNSFETTEQTGYGGGNARVILKLFLFFTYPVWGIFRYIYLLAKYNKKKNESFAKEMFDSFFKSEKTTERYEFTKQIQEKYNKKKLADNVSMNRIRSKYAYLDGDDFKKAVDNEAKKIKKCEFVIMSNKKTYDLISIEEDIRYEDPELAHTICFGTAFLLKKGNDYKILLDSGRHTSKYALHILDQNKLQELIDKVANETYDPVLHVHQIVCDTFRDIDRNKK